MRKYLLSILFVSLSNSKSVLKSQNLESDIFKNLVENPSKLLNPIIKLTKIFNSENTGLDKHKIVKKSEVQSEYPETYHGSGANPEFSDVKLGFRERLIKTLGPLPATLVQPTDKQSSRFGEKLMKSQGPLPATLVQPTDKQRSRFGEKLMKSQESLRATMVQPTDKQRSRFGEKLMKSQGSLQAIMVQPTDKQSSTFGERFMKQPTAGRADRLLTPRSTASQQIDHSIILPLQRQENHPTVDLKPIEWSSRHAQAKDNTPLSLAEMMSVLRRFRRVKEVQHNMRRRMGAAKMIVISHSLIEDKVSQAAGAPAIQPAERAGQQH